MREVLSLLSTREVSTVPWGDLALSSTKFSAYYKGVNRRQPLKYGLYSRQQHWPLFTSTVASFFEY
jgi:hypothetical protein